MAVMALSRTPNPTQLQKTLVLNDWYLKGEDWEYPWGSIQMLGKSDGLQLQAMAPHFLAWDAKLTPNAVLNDLARHGVDFWMSSEDLPRPENRVTLDKGGRVHLHLEADNNVEPLTRLRKRFDSMLADLGFHKKSHQRGVYLHEGMHIAATAHQAGTARFGSDPEISVLDLNCRAHQLDNLYVVDSSFFPSIGAVNPTLTIIANALRVGDHLAGRLSG
jgi:choline dehydrogenase-like flavoprotein